MKTMFLHSLGSRPIRRNVLRLGLVALVLALCVLLAGCGAGGTANPANNSIRSFSTTCGKWSVVTSPSLGGEQGTSLNSVAALSATDAWAVGDDYTSPTSEQTLIEHWNGKTWKVVKSPSPGPNGNDLYGVAAVSANNVWAVGYEFTANGDSQALVEHWNGKTWSVISWPGIGPGSGLYSVSALSATNIWAVGTYLSTSGPRTLVVHWNGTDWGFIFSPSPGTHDNELTGVSAHAANDVWAVGTYSPSSTVNLTLIEHWNGASWSVVQSTNTAAATNLLKGVSAVSATDVWAVGYDSNGIGTTQSLIEHWNGTTWNYVFSPFLGSNFLVLSGVVAVSATEVWAVGRYHASSGATHTLIERWNGASWNVVPSPNPGPDDSLFSVAALSRSSSVLAVGNTNTGSPLTEATC